MRRAVAAADACVVSVFFLNAGIAQVDRRDDLEFSGSFSNWRLSSLLPEMGLIVYSRIHELPDNVVFYNVAMGLDLRNHSTSRKLKKAKHA